MPEPAKVAIVTGATKSMGIAIARRLAADGMAVFGCGRNEEAGRAAAAAIVAAGGQAEFLRCDVTDETDVRQTVAAAVERFGRLDVVVNNAAATDVIRGGRELPVIAEEAADFLHVMAVDVLGPFFFAKHAIPEMLEAGGGVFVHITSIAAVRAMPGMTAYGPSKAALEALSNQIAVDYGRQGIRSACVRVNGIRVDDNRRLFDHPEVGPLLRRNQMIDRTGVPEDVAAAVAYLASDGAAFVTGTSLAVDGGSLSKQDTPVLADIYSD